MQIRLQDLLDNISGDATTVLDRAPEREDVVQATAEPVRAANDPDGPAVAPSCPPTPRRMSAVIEAAIDAAGLGEPDLPATVESAAAPEQAAAAPEQAAAAPEQAAAAPEQASAAPEQQAAAAPDDAAHPSAEQPAATAEDDEELESQHFSPSLLSPMQRRRSALIDAAPAPERVETSGLIDVRTMAAAYLGHGAAGAAAGQPEPAVPVPLLHEGSSPILLPTARQDAPRGHTIYWVLGACGVLALMALTAAVTAMVVKQSISGAAPVAAAPAVEQPLAPAAAVTGIHAGGALASTAPIVVGTPDDQAGSTAGAAAALPGDVDRTDRRSDERSERRGEDHSAANDRDRDRGDRDRDRDRGDRSRSAEHAPASSGASTRTGDAPRTGDTAARPGSSAGTTSADSSTSPRPTSSGSASGSGDLATAAGGDAVAAPAKPASAGAGAGEPCDEVTCLVSGVGCCGKAPPKRTEDPGADSSLPARPTKAEISEGMSAAAARLQSCGDRHGVRGAVTIKVHIKPDGKVGSASTTQGTADFQSCVAGAARSAVFPATREGTRVSYPVVLR